MSKSIGKAIITVTGPIEVKDFVRFLLDLPMDAVLYGVQEEFLSDQIMKFKLRSDEFPKVHPGEHIPIFKNFEQPPHDPDWYKPKDNMCKCKNPKVDVSGGRYNCGGAFVMTCHECYKLVKCGKEKYDF